MTKVYLKEDITTKEMLDIMMISNHITDCEIVKNQNGKPYFKNKKIYFSLSDKDNITVGVLSKRKIGVDIEKISYRPLVVKYFFTEEEQKIIADNKDKAFHFTKIWVMKEAFLKMKGLSLESIRKIDTTKINKVHIEKYKSYLVGYVEE